VVTTTAAVQGVCGQATACVVESIGWTADDFSFSDRATARASARHVHHRGHWLDGDVALQPVGLERRAVSLSKGVAAVAKEAAGVLGGDRGHRVVDGGVQGLLRPRAGSATMPTVESARKSRYTRSGDRPRAAAIAAAFSAPPSSAPGPAR